MMLKVFLTIGLLQVFTMLVQLVRTKALALLLGPEALGPMAVIDKLLAVIVQTVSLSLPFAALRFLPALWTKDPLAFRDRFTRMRNVLIVAAGAALAVSLVVTLVRPATWGVQLVPYRTVVLCAVLSLPVLVLVPFVQNAVAGRLEQNRAMLVALGHAGVMAAAAAGILWRGLAGYYLLYAALGLVLVTVASRVVLRGIAVEQNAPRFPLGLPRQMWRFTAALLSVTFIMPYAALYVHYKVLSDHGAQTAGWMQAAIGIGLAVRGVLGSAHPVFLTPNVNREGTPADRMAWANAFQATFCFLAAAALPPLLLFPQLFVRALYSGAFLPGAAFVVLFVLNEVLTLLTGTYQAIVIALDELGFHVAQNVGAQLLMIAVAALLVTRFGILGAGLSVLSGPLCMFFATTIFLYRRYGLRMPGRVIGLTALLVLVLVACGVFGSLRPELTLATVGLKAGAYAAVAGLFATLLTSDERARLWAMVDGVRGRLRPAAR
jgi:PST family polysaccharide transporter